MLLLKTFYKNSVPEYARKTLAYRVRNGDVSVHAAIPPIYNEVVCKIESALVQQNEYYDGDMHEANAGYMSDGSIVGIDFGGWSS